MSPIRSIPQWLAALRREGFAVGVDTHLFVAQVLASMPPHTPVDEYPEYLCPVVAHAPEEQARFMEVWETYKGLLVEEEEKAQGTGHKGEEEKKEENSQQPDDTASAPRRSRYMWAGLALAVLLIAGVGTWIYFQQEPEQPVVQPINPPAPRVGCMDKRAKNYDGYATQACDSCCEYREQTKDDREQTKDEQPKQEAPQEKTTYRPVFEPVQEAPLPKLESADTGWWGKVLHYRWAAFGGVAGGLLIAVLGHALYRRARKRFVLRRQRNDEPPYLLPIRVTQGYELRTDETHYAAANALRRRSDAEQWFLSLTQTIEATARAGGRFTPRYVQRSRGTTYLALIDRRTGRDHHAQLAAWFTRQLVGSDVEIETWWYDGDPTLVWNEAHPQGVYLDTLQTRLADARLLLFSDGYSLLDPLRTGAPHAQRMRAPLLWRERVLLTPAPAGDWDYREATLARQWLVLPANTASLPVMVEHFELAKTQNLRDWKYHLAKDDKRLTLPDDATAMEALRAAGYEDLLPWLAGCALYPALHWDLTVRMGLVLGPVEFAALARLARLDWFRSGEMPDPVRAALIAWLTDSQPETVRLLREELVRVLNENAPDSRSYAADEHTLYVAANNLLLGDTSPETLATYRQQAARGLREDAVTLAAVDARHAAAWETAVPPRWRRFFFDRGRSVLGVRTRGTAVLAALALLLLAGLAALLPTGNDCPSAVADARGTWCLKDRSDSLAWLEIQMSDALHQLQRDRADSLLAQLDTLTVEMDTADYPAHYDAAAHTALRAAYNDRNDAALLAWLRKGDTLGAAASIVTLSSPLDVTKRGNGNPYPAHDRLHLAGIAAYYTGDTALARALLRTLLSAVPDTAAYWRRNAPNLLHLLRHNFVAAPAHGRIRVRDGKQYGYLDSLGRMAIAPRYEAAEDFGPDGLATVRLNGKALTIDRTGTAVETNGQNAPKYALTLNFMPFNGGTVTGGGTYPEGKAITVVATPKAGFRFKQWEENGKAISTTASTTVYLASGDRTLKAVFESAGQTAQTQQTQQSSSGCGSLYFDVKAGTLNGVGPKASIDEIKRQFPCFTGESAEGSSSNNGGGIFFADHNFYYYTKKDWIEFRSAFKGSMSMQILNQSQPAVHSSLGSPETVYKNNDFYRTSTGCIMVTYTNGTATQVTAWGIGPKQAAVSID